MFFNQNVGDGANLFLIIIAILIGFVAGLSYIDNMKVKKEQEKKQ